jgi:hypothetical protein
VLAVQTESIVSTVIPRLLVKHVSSRATAQKPMADARAAELAQLLVAPDVDDAYELIEQSIELAVSPVSLFTNLFEPTARILGDLWSQDTCSEFEVSIGLCHLQSAMRRISFDRLSAPVIRSEPRRVLLAPQPGEPHSFCAALNSEMLMQVGWHPSCEFPDSDKALQDLVANTWFDALDLSLSPALRREHWLPRMAETIRKARQASCNPALAVVVSGRVFGEKADACASVGADAFTASALQVERRIMRSLLSRKARPAANFAWL